MIKFTKQPVRILKEFGKSISCFNIQKFNIDEKTVYSFGEEWNKFNSFTEKEISDIGQQYFDILPPEINKDSLVLDVGCGTGRWSKYLSDKVKWIDAVDPSNAVFAAAKLLSETNNVRVSQASADDLPFESGTFDLVMSVGVLHHIPDTQQALADITTKAKQGGFVYVYLYYALDNRGQLFRVIFKLTNAMRFFISKLPSFMKKLACEVIAFLIYLPLVGISYLFKRIFKNSKLWEKIPLSFYVGTSLKVIRNDALDRFGTPLEQRFTKQQVVEMMEQVGLRDITVSNNMPYWHAIGKRVDN
ncbi:class I SAM-dependent methyltransferase [Aquella oligotrophica]|uniref:Class I SAM-dependent methyltransferase n=1 Tax=Aquella oligotrophica TaxID=2067065 RepID=A0A2I7N9K8_9NEIS|nr:class I SAM-dependent methyltransferase [Aquella oligotrophica]AUR53122.1 class I SAM-dependent methyltransferase [Aquella oligotrophica]